MQVYYYYYYYYYYKAETWTYLQNMDCILT
jgi:hypothetical protein